MYEGSLCVCCMSTDELVQLFGEEENYAKILAACLNVQLAEDEGHDAICSNCVAKLKDCVRFKRQVLKSLSILSSVDLKDLISEDDMQVLQLNSLKTSDLEPELQTHAVQKPELRTHAVKEPELRTHAVKKPELRTHAVKEPELRTHAVKKPELRTHAVKEPELQTHAVKKPELQTHAVKKPELQTHAVKKPELQTHAVKRPELRSRAVKKPELRTPAVKAGCVGDNNDIQDQISPCSEDWQEEEKQTQTPKRKATTTTACSKIKQVKEKKIIRGRPRLHPPDKKMPYEVGGDELVCRECGETFANNVTLKVHYNKHFGEHKCTVCGKSFITRTSLSKHERCHMKGPFKCLHCEQVFRSINSLNSHKRFKHSAALPFKCPVKECAQRFATITHRLTHLAEKHRIAEYNYHCKYCSKKFRTSSERAKHVACRHEIRYLPCRVCGVRCRQATLKSHLRTHLRGEGDERVKNDEKRFVCKLCSHEFAQKKTLTYHIGSHVRRGDYHGDPNFLILDKRDHKNNHGLLDDVEEQLDESNFSDKQEDLDFKDTDLNIEDTDDINTNIVDNTVANDIDSNIVDNIDIDTLDIDFIEENLQKSDTDEINEICTDLAFSTPEYVI